MTKIWQTKLHIVKLTMAETT